MCSAGCGKYGLSVFHNGCDFCAKYLSARDFFKKYPKSSTKMLENSKWWQGASVETVETVETLGTARIISIMLVIIFGVLVGLSKRIIISPLVPTEQYSLQLQIYFNSSAY